MYYTGNNSISIYPLGGSHDLTYKSFVWHFIPIRIIITYIYQFNINYNNPYIPSAGWARHTYWDLRSQHRLRDLKSRSGIIDPQLRRGRRSPRNLRFQVRLHLGCGTSGSHLGSKDLKSCSGIFDPQTSPRLRDLRFPPRLRDLKSRSGIFDPQLRRGRQSPRNLRFQASLWTSVTPRLLCQDDPYIL